MLSLTESSTEKGCDLSGVYHDSSECAEVVNFVVLKQDWIFSVTMSLKQTLTNFLRT